MKFQAEKTNQLVTKNKYRQKIDFNLTFFKKIY